MTIGPSAGTARTRTPSAAVTLRSPKASDSEARSIETSGVDFFVGSGFGHGHHGDGRTQRFAWLGKTIPPVDFKIAVTSSALRPSEKRDIP